MEGVFVWRGEAGTSGRLVWLRRRADAAYWDDHWGTTSLQQLVRDARGHRVLRDLFLRNTNVGDRVLESGCGRGQWVAVLREHGRCVSGVDFARRTLAESKGEQPDLPLLAADVRALPFPDRAFDAYISLGLAEHFLDGPRRLLDEARRVLRPGGCLLISVPYFSPLRRLRASWGGYRDLPGAAPPRDEFYQFAFQRAEFAGHLAEAGFRVERSVPFGIGPGLAEVPVMRALRRTAKRIAGQHDPGPSHTSRATGRDDARATGRGRLGALGSQLVNAPPTRRLAGHMCLFVARSR